MNEFVKYLNGLHNYNAQNQNAYGERNVESPYYAETLVPIDVCNHIITSIENNAPHIIILTGHAGDGKTSIMFQVMEQLGAKESIREPISTMSTESGKTVVCIKDFSELADDEKLKVLSNVVKYPEDGKFVFMVANTGPLINTFGQMFEDDEETDLAKMEMIDAMDSNSGDIIEVMSHPMMIINIAAIDNTGFAEKFLNKIQNDKLWQACDACSKKEYCHVYRNHSLISENKARVYEFITNYYIWQNEYGTRLTIRSMTEHLAYMITAGDNCEDVVPNKEHRKLFSNLFFGYEGVIPNPNADNVLAVRLAKESNIFLNRLRADEDLLIRRKYGILFGESIESIINNTDGGLIRKQEWDDELRRMYLFMSTVNNEQHKKDIEDIFSKQFIPYLTVRNTGTKPTKAQKDLVIDALRMIYMGTVISNNSLIPITMGAESGITQSVQLIAGKLNVGDIDLLAESGSSLNQDKYNLVLRIKKQDKSKFILTLPMMNHFEELRNGVIATGMDPQLSYGIENLKATLLWLADRDEDTFDILVLNNTGFSEQRISIEDGKISIQ